MNNRVYVLLIITSTLLIGCAGPGPTDETVWVLNLAPSPCEAAEQYTKNPQITGNYEDKVEVKGSTTTQQLVEYRDQVALLQNQSKAACDLLNRGRITFEQYQSETREVRAELAKLKTEVTE